MIPLLEKEDIEVRIGQTGKTKEGKAWVTLLLYKDARCDMRILDDVFGPYGWQRSHELIAGNLYCTVSILAENGEWIRKQDVGVESNTEKEKGQASDAFKRACVNVGIGRELYTAPRILVWLADGEYDAKADKIKPKQSVGFSVSDIAYNDRREITKLAIVDRKERERFRWAR